MEELHNQQDQQDLAYLTAATGDEFALFKKKNKYLLYHGDPRSCKLINGLKERIKAENYYFVAHTHPGEEVPRSSTEDKKFLKWLGQQSSIVIGARTGEEKLYRYDDI